MRHLKWNRLRAANVLCVLLYWCGAAVCVLVGGGMMSLAGSLILGGGIFAVVLVYDITASLCQRKHFIRQAEESGFGRYAEELRARKF